MVGKVIRTIQKHNMLKAGDGVVVALSGGADSCALLSVLADLAPSYALKLTIAHFNHGVRGEDADADEAFCRDMAQKYGFVFVAEKMRRASVPKGMSPEDYFRRERYCFLDRVAQDYRADKIALGHHQNDQAETVLLNMLRGSGLDGLKGFLPVRDGKYIRPLMEISKQEIQCFLKAKDLKYREDLSNQCGEFVRNGIRLELIPFLKEKFNPQIEQCLSRMAEIVREDDECLNRIVGPILASPDIRREESGVSFSADFFARLQPGIRMRLLKSILEDLAPRGHGFSYAHIQAAAGLIMTKSTGKSVCLPFHLHIEKQYDLIFIGKTAVHSPPDYKYQLSIPGTLDLSERKIRLSLRRSSVDEVDLAFPNRIYMDADRLKEPLWVRNRRPGDWFEPLGTHGRQKIKKLFIDRKIPVNQRESLALLADQVSVIWIENMHLNERVKISPETKHVVVMEIDCRAKL